MFQVWNDRYLVQPTCVERKRRGYVSNVEQWRRGDIPNVMWNDRGGVIFRFLVLLVRETTKYSVFIDKCRALC